MGYIGAHGVAALHRYNRTSTAASITLIWPCSLSGLAVSISSLFGCYNTYRIHVFGCICSTWISIFPSIGLSSTKMGSFCSWIAAILIPGCDALACAFESLAFGSTAMCGRSTFWFWVISAVPFYCATWEHYFTNTLILPIVNGPTEGLMLIYMIHFFTGFVGAEWWAQSFGKSIPFLSWVPFISEITMNKAILFLMIMFAVIPTVSFNSIPLSRYWVEFLCGIVYQLSPSDVLGNYPHLIIVGSGLAFGILVGRMILAHLCDEPSGLKTNMCMSLFYLPFAIANVLTARLNDRIPLVDDFWVLLGYFAYTYTVALYLHFATSVIHEITTALGIYCFRITRKEA